MTSDWQTRISNNMELRSSHRFISAGRLKGYTAALTDIEVGDVLVEDNRIRQERARPEFDKLWKELEFALIDDPRNQQKALKEVDEIRRLYVGAFTKNYKDALRDQEVDTEAAPSVSSAQRATFQGATAAIVNIRRTADGRLYEVELNDPDFLSEPVRVEVVVDDEGSAEFREVIDDDR